MTVLHSGLPFLRAILGLAAIVLAVLNVTGAQRNRALQAEIEAQQAAVQRGQTFANLNNSLIQLLARTAAEQNDPALRTLLSDNGVTFQVQAPQVPPSVRP